MEGTRVSHYEIVRLIGRGGMGEVYEALDLDLGRRVALKFIAAELASEPEAFRRFEREARLAAALSHPHIATLYAFERDAGRPFIAMELMSGESLRVRLAAGPLAVAESLRARRPDAPEAVESLLARMLAKDPGARPDAAAAARELAQLSGEALSEAELRSLEPPPATHATEEVEVERVPGRELAPRAGG